MPDRNVFALQQSTLSEFLFAEVGPELNGSTLTVLSVLARLGWDPWEEASRWTLEPRSSVAAVLSHSIGQMPLVPDVLTNAGSIAARLVLLLPTRLAATDPTESKFQRLFYGSRFWLIAAVYGVLAGILLGLATDPVLKVAASPIHTAPAVVKATDPIGVPAHRRSN